MEVKQMKAQRRYELLYRALGKEDPVWSYNQMEILEVLKATEPTFLNQ